VTTDETRAALIDMTDAFKRGDHERLVERYDDDIDWALYAPMLVFPFAGRRRGKTDVLASLLGVYQRFTIAKYEVPIILADGDRAASIAEIEVVMRSTGRSVTSQLASFSRFRGGKMIEYRGYTDSFDAAEQVLGFHIDV
jgi:ketosteroid isomerase-like protein